MKAVVYLLACACAFSALAEEDASAPFYVDFAGTAMMPRGGSAAKSRGGASVRCGRYLTDALAFEGEVGFASEATLVAARALWHFHGWEEFNRLFGYERWDPFVTLGARGLVGDDGGFGPEAQLGTLYYLTESWALRFEAGALMDCDGRPDAIYLVSAGVRYSF